MARKRNASKETDSAAAPSPAPVRPPFLGEPPAYRRLRVYAFDPSLDTELDTALINQTVIRVPWETYRDPDARTADERAPGRFVGLRPGPIGEYLEVIDFDPPSNGFYDPIDLDDPRVLAQDGLPPSEGSPQFHQQMTYAVAMTTIGHFERALGRKAMWSPRIAAATPGGPVKSQFVPRLRIYPHALREPNAFYSPDKKALLFGYFSASRDRPGRNLPGGVVFTCLSHDIIAHETTHALLDGLNRYFLYATNPDVPAFHEAFADIVALFQHFTYPEALKHQIARNRGDLARQSLLGELAQQFGQGIGQYGALRSAIGGINPITGEWEPSKPDPNAYATQREPHTRGAILVAVIFEAFLTVYRSRIADLFRIATGGTGVLPQGEIHPDLVQRLANEAADVANHMLMMCIRALDYCPAIDITFGEYLRALVTADLDVTPDDQRGYRLALLEAFRRWGIFPEGVRTLSVDSLKWQGPPPQTEDRLISDLIDETLGERKRLDLGWGLSGNRRGIFFAAGRMRKRLHDAIATRPIPRAVQHYLGLSLDVDALGSIERDRAGRPIFEVHSVRPARRIGQRGEAITDLVVVLIQRRRGYLDETVQAAVDASTLTPAAAAAAGHDHFILRGGCTLLINLEKRELRYAIRKPIDSVERLEQQRRFEAGPLTAGLMETYFGHFHDDPTREPFALLHRGVGDGAD